MSNNNSNWEFFSSIKQQKKIPALTVKSDFMVMCLDGERLLTMVSLRFEELRDYRGREKETQESFPVVSDLKPYRQLVLPAHTPLAKVSHVVSLLAPHWPK